MKDKILFVTKGGENCDDGFSYVLELAKTLNADVEALVIRPQHLAKDFEDVMAAAAFAEAGDLRSVREIMDAEPQACIEKLQAKITALSEKAEEASIGLMWHTSDGDVSSAVKAVLKDKPYIDMVLLSPSLSESKRSLDIRKLLKNISKPIVHISKPASAEI